MRKLSSFILLFFFVMGCGNRTKQEESNQPQLAKSLKQAAIDYVFPDRVIDNKTYMLGLTYYQYINRQSMKESFTVTDSIKVDKFWLLFYKYSINGHDYYSTEWFINIKGNYFVSGQYISDYNVDEIFDKENVDLVKALVHKAELWESKSEKRWWKYIE